MRFLCSLFFICLIFRVGSQERNDIIQQRIEFIAEQSALEEIDLTSLFYRLDNYYDNPINLNTATSDELEDLGLLTVFQIRDLLLHIQLHGKLISVYELQSLLYWDLTAIQRVFPFVTVDNKLDQLHIGWKEMIRNAKFESFVRYQSNGQIKEGYKDLPDSAGSAYLGNQGHYYARFRYAYRANLSIGVTADKDPGEEFFKGSNSKGFDFYSFHGFYKGGKYIRSVVVGDYQVQVGQGLNVWTGYAFAKTADVTNTKKSADPIRPYTSTDESRFFRGAAIEVGYKKIAMMLFGSSKKMDGSLSVDSLTNEGDYVSAIYQSGLHRTSGEVADKHTLTEKIAGSNIRYKTNNFQFGFSGVYQSYDKVFSKEMLAYNQFDFRGKEMVSLSTDYNWIFRNLNLFGEIARSSNHNSIAQLHGLLLSVNSGLSLSIVYRDYDKSYRTFYNSGFSEGGKMQNEKGLYVGSKMKINNVLTCNTYIDYFQFPWLKYQVSTPSSGYDFLVQLTYKPTKQLEVYVRFREQLQQKNSPSTDGGIVPVENVLQRNFRFNLSHKAMEGVILKSRIEFVTINRPATQLEKGMIITQDIQFKPLSKPIDITLRYALFQTDSYNSRIYTYESNALNVFSIPAYCYQGSRAYILVRYTFFRKFDIWVKYGTLVYLNRKSIGTGPETINGNVKSDFTIQLRMKL